MSLALDSSSPSIRPKDTTAFANLVVFYLCLVVYELTVKYSLAHFISRIYGPIGFEYATAKEWVYLLISLVTPLAVLFCGTRINQAAQIMFITFAVFLLLPTPIYFAAKVPLNVFFPVYICLWISTAVLAYCSGKLFAVKFKPMRKGSFGLFVWFLVLFFGVALLYGATQNFRLVTFADIYKVRESAEYASDFTVRVVHMYIFSLGGFLLTLALAQKRYLLACITFVAFLVCYLETQLKTAALAPVWIVYVYVAHRYFFGRSAVRYFLTLAAPFFLGAALAALFPNDTTLSGDHLLVFGFTNLVNFRMYSIPNLALSIYYDFFRMHPVTYWSHISIIDLFIKYPYGDKSIAEVLNDTYALGNWNASFLSMDSIGAYGYGIMPLLSAVMGGIFIAINTASRGLSMAFLALVMIMPSILFLERPIATCLLTGGVLFLIPYLAWMPREISQGLSR